MPGRNRAAPGGDRYMSVYEPRRTVWQQLDFCARMTFPALLTVLLLILASLPLGPTGGSVGSAVLVPSVVFWTVFRPQVMPPPIVLLLGVLADLLSSTLLGVNAMALLVLFSVLLPVRKMIAPLSFPLVWCNVLLLALLYAVLQWCMLSLLTLRLLPVISLLPQIAMTAVLYPALSLLLTRLHHMIDDAA